MIQFAVYREFLDDHSLWNPNGEGAYSGGLQININASAEGYRELAAYFLRLADRDTSDDDRYHEHHGPFISTEGQTRVHVICRKDDPRMKPS